MGSETVLHGVVAAESMALVGPANETESADGGEEVTDESGLAFTAAEPLSFAARVLSAGNSKISAIEAREAESAG